MKPFKSVVAGRGRTRVHAKIYEVGSDLLTVLGGEGQHIGAASIAEASSGETGDVATISARGHREAELTEYLSKAICAATGRRTVTIAGIHLDRITKAEIETIRQNVRQLVQLLDFEETRR
jgi:hypothetical protein